jgi:quercetin dioxygenase-like cupin family protein
MGVSLTTSADAEHPDRLGDRIRFTGALEGTDAVLVEVTVPPGSGVPLHRHRSAEVFRVLTGRVDFLLPGEGAPQRIGAGPGDAVTVPPDAVHGYANAGHDTAMMMVLLDRTMAAFFRELGRPEPITGPPGPEDMARIGAACARHGIAFVGPPPG